MDAMKANWKFTVSMDFIHTNDLATQPLDPTTSRTEKTKCNFCFISTNRTTRKESNATA